MPENWVLMNMLKNGSDEYELKFVIKTEMYNVTILALTCYVKGMNLYIYDNYGFRGTTAAFCEKVKCFMDGLMHGTKAELNFLEDDGVNFYGFVTENNRVEIKNNYNNMTSGLTYKTSLIDGLFYDSINKVIDKLHEIQ